MDQQKMSSNSSIPSFKDTNNLENNIIEVEQDYSELLYLLPVDIISEIIHLLIMLRNKRYDEELKRRNQQICYLRSTSPRLKDIVDNILENYFPILLRHSRIGTEFKFELEGGNLSNTQSLLIDQKEINSDTFSFIKSIDITSLKRLELTSSSQNRNIYSFKYIPSSIKSLKFNYNGIEFDARLMLGNIISLLII